MSQTYSVTIITGYGDDPTPLATVTEKAAHLNLPVTVTSAYGFHPKWGDEYVLIITALTTDELDPFLDTPAYPYRILAEHLRDAFKQDAVLFHAVPVPPFELL